MRTLGAERVDVVESDDPAEAKLHALIDWPELFRTGYDADAQVFAPRADDLLFGYAECKTAACDQVARTSLGLCWRCDQLWNKLGPEADFASFCESAPEPHRRSRSKDALCAVCRTPGHERPVRAHGLCAACEQAMGKRGQSKEQYVAGDEEFPPATPRPSFGRCAVASCTRFAWRASPALCEQHHRHWRSEGRPSGRAMQAWCARQGTVDRDGRLVVLSRLSERLRLELLYGLQRAIDLGHKAKPLNVQSAVNGVRVQGVASILELSLDKFKQGMPAWLFLSFAADQVGLALSSRDSEVRKDVWDQRVFGKIPGRMRFSPISQAWLRESAKAWAAERIDTVRTPRVLQVTLRVLRAFSESLRRNRPDGGVDPALVQRADLAAFVNDLAHLEARGDLARNTRRTWVTELDRFLREARAMGLSRPGGPMHSLPENAVLYPTDHLPSASREEQGRALPQVVLDQLLHPAALAVLEELFGEDRRAMVELEASVGRRTGELCTLYLECLAFEEIPDESGQLRSAPVLVHDMPKVGVVGYRLPIDEETAVIIRAQQARVIARYPDTEPSDLVLFPAPVMNPRGTKGMNVSTFDLHFRTWVDRLDELRGEDGEPYDRQSITVYSFRHSFAQRHADSGTPIEVVAELMGHTRLTSTQIYYRVTDKRKRKAVDLLAALQVDREGTRTRPLVERLLDAEATREAIGQVAVPFGVCTEPTNVKAHGQVCPFRHQCFGCTYFRSDPSFLPELRSYLTRLLGDRERLRAALPELEDWARLAAIPSAEEVASLRRIIDRCEELVGSLTDDERVAVEEAVVVLRRARAQLDTSVPVRFRGVVAQPVTRLYPNVERQRQRGGSDGD
jgi:integrase